MLAARTIDGMDFTTIPPAYPSPPAAAPTAAPVLVARGLTKSYGPTPALAGVSLALAAGESVAVMGASGSGKSTLLHCLAGILSPDTGTVELRTATGVQPVHGLSADARAKVRRDHYGFVFQQGLLLPELTAVENVALPLLLTGATRSGANQVAAAWLAHLGLAGLEDRRPGQLSGGQAQRVAVARAQVTSPAVVFADEPTGALDSATSTELMTALLEATVGQGRSLVVVTHDEAVAIRCTRILRIADGRIVHESAPGVHPAGTRLAVNAVEEAAR